MNWSKQKVLVAGGAGMIGSHLARRLVELDANVTVVDNLSSGSLQNIRDLNIKFYPYDLRVPGVCNGLAREKDVVFQLAADMGGIGYITAVGADIMYNSGLINLNMMEACKENKVPRVFFSSSACIYPEYKQLCEDVVPLKEEDAEPAQPDQFYGWEKLFTEKLCQAYQRDYGMAIRIARFHNVYGDGYTSFDKHKGKAPCHLILKAISGEKEFVVWGDGKQTRSFLYVEDCIDAVLALTDSDVKEPLNIGTDRLISIDDLAKLVIRISGKRFNILHDVTKPQGVRGRNADLTKIKALIGWAPKVDLEEGLKQVYEWAKEHYDDLEGI